MIVVKFIKVKKNSHSEKRFIFFSEMEIIVKLIFSISTTVPNLSEYLFSALLLGSVVMLFWTCVELFTVQERGELVYK